MKRSLLTFATGLMILPGLALCDPCKTESVADLTAGNGTTCTIGNLTFTFGPGAYTTSVGLTPGNSLPLTDADNATAITQLNEYAAAIFAPNLTANGFTLSAAIDPITKQQESFSSSVQSGDNLVSSVGTGKLSYSVSVTSGMITGLTTIINASTLSGTPPGVDADLYEASTDATNVLISRTDVAEVSPYAELSQNFTYPADYFFPGNPPVDTPAPPSNAETDSYTTEDGSFSFSQISSDPTFGTPPNPPLIPIRSRQPATTRVLLGSVRPRAVQ